MKYTLIISKWTANDFWWNEMKREIWMKLWIQYTYMRNWKWNKLCIIIKSTSFLVREKHPLSHFSPSIFLFISRDHLCINRIIHSKFDEYAAIYVHFLCFWVFVLLSLFCCCKNSRNMYGLSTAILLLNNLLHRRLFIWTCSLFNIRI